jgi:hypothetical protein
VLSRVDGGRQHAHIRPDPISQVLPRKHLWATVPAHASLATRTDHVKQERRIQAQGPAQGPAYGPAYGMVYAAWVWSPTASCSSKYWSVLVRFGIGSWPSRTWPARLIASVSTAP